ncbi:MAG TPA: WYL domain-containing protein [Candidatus Agrococcus pullicola]|uniref:WYL domain-containing protein n=1 Tax=Candidatus Agrococcus pullicola TaxID=2838429 RepID=A0A9D1YS96_9MICO|nr:WYL domain-containing protein [Candidatus Agrococcus pullicola]
MADVTERVLRLLATLQTGRAFAGEELASRLAVSPRTLRRDMERLRSYGYPVETKPGPGGHYRLTAGQRMPPLVFEDEEAVATIIGLASLAATPSTSPDGLSTAVERAYGKIDLLLPARLRARAAALRASIESEGTPLPDLETDAIAVLAEAIASREIVTFSYIDAKGVSTDRRAEAHRHVHMDRRWYFFSWDLARDQWRVFRTDRISDVRRTGATYAPRALPLNSAIAYLRSGLGETFETLEATVEATLLAVADALRHEDAEFASLEHDRTRATLAVDSWQRILAPLAELHAGFRVSAPPSTMIEIQRFAERLTSASEPDSPPR